ncbi:glycogen synthase [Sphingobacteriales bacterium CHB3]|nr:glycogen synthase [Sphingobacteriales bacterium CHB3]
MNIAIAASECVPFAKAGGLADVAGALPKYLRTLGCDVKVFLPKYNTIDESKYDLHYEYAIGEIPVRVAGAAWPVHVSRANLPGSDVPVYFIDCPHFFHRGRIYTNDFDEDGRFILFSKAVIETLQRLQWVPDVIHCNDWQTGLLPLLLKDNYSWDRMFDGTATLYSIHNIGYQGLFGKSVMDIAEIRPDRFSALEMHGGVSMMKGGILSAEIITTVSETYAQEILTPEYGAGMESYLLMRRDDLHGVLNGIDTEVWNPETDPHLPHHYSKENPGGKYLNKKNLLEKVGMPYDVARPLIGIVSRLVAQKGFDLIAETFNSLMELDAQWVILGSGEDRYERMFTAIHHALPHKVWTYIGFNNELAHLIEAASDMFLMPSRYEPCGLNQMYSLRYGTIPIVRKTGGLADTVHDWHEFQSFGSDEVNGFSFNDAAGYALADAVGRAVEMYDSNKPAWHQMMMHGMNADLSWDASAKKYVKLYEMAAGKRGT